MKKSNPTIKAQILRSAFYVLLLPGVCAIPLALAQWELQWPNDISDAIEADPRNSHLGGPCRLSARH